MEGGLAGDGCVTYGSCEGVCVPVCTHNCLQEVALSRNALDDNKGGFGGRCLLLPGGSLMVMGCGDLSSWPPDSGQVRNPSPSSVRVPAILEGRCQVRPRCGYMSCPSLLLFVLAA